LDRGKYTFVPTLKKCRDGIHINASLYDIVVSVVYY